MSAIEWLAQGALLLLLAVAVPFAWRLERQIAALRREGAAVTNGAAGMAEATEAVAAMPPPTSLKPEATYLPGPGGRRGIR